MTAISFIAEMMRKLALNADASGGTSLRTYPANDDAFGRQKVALPNGRFDMEALYDLQPLIMDNISVNGTIAHQANSRDILATIGSDTPDDVAGLRSRVWIHYTAGDAQDILLTGTPDVAGIGGGTMYTFLRSNVTGSVVLTKNPMSTWAQQPTNTPDWSKSHIFDIDFQSLRVGRIRFALVQDGDMVAVDEIDNDNIRNTGYWQMATLPPYWKLYNDSGNE